MRILLLIGHKSQVIALRLSAKKSRYRGIAGSVAAGAMQRPEPLLLILIGAGFGYLYGKAIDNAPPSARFL